MNFTIIIFGLVGGILILINPFIGLLATVALIPQAMIPALSNMFAGIFSAVTPIKIVGGLTFIAALIQHIAKGKNWDAFKHKGYAFFILFVIYLFVNGLAMPSSFTRENFTVFFSFIIMSFCILSLVDSPKRFNVLIWVALISIFVVAASTLINYFGYHDVSVRMSGGAYGPNYFAIGLLPFIGISFYGIVYHKNKFAKLMAIIICVTLVGALIITYSRGGYIGLAIMGLFAILKAKKKFLGLIVVAVSAIIIVNLIPDYMWNRFENTKIESTDKNNGTVSSTKRRLLLAKAAWQMFLDHPVFGVGIGNYYWECSDYQPLVPGRAHNMYLEIMAEMGIIGIFLFMSIILYTLKILNNIAKSEYHMRDYARGIYMGLIGFLIAAVFLHDQQDKSLWLLIFLSFALNRLFQGEHKNEKK